MSQLRLRLLLLLSIIITVNSWQFPFSHSTPLRPATTLPKSHSLKLRRGIHLHASDRSLPPLHRTYSQDDLNALEINSGDPSAKVLKTTREIAWKPSSNQAYQAARRSSYYAPRALSAGRGLSIAEVRDAMEGSFLTWEAKEIETPEITDVETLASLGKMASNAYTQSDDTAAWWDVGDKWNMSDSFGWFEDGLRGHVFADDSNSTVVVAIKGTSAGFVGGSGTTGRNDKINDNLLFSCCCARIDWSWSTVCDCYAGGYTCKQDCIEEAVMGGSAYYPIATDLFNNISAIYPHAQIWLVGHSLGGALASMLSLTYGVPSVSFEAPGDLLPSRRLHLPLPPGLTYSSSRITTHVYHTADPIAMGVCNGALSSCAVAGFALESRCHTGRSIVYDTVGRLGWAVDIRTHSIRPIIEQLLIEEWVPRMKKKPGGGWWPGRGNNRTDDDDQEDMPDTRTGAEGNGVPEPITEEECMDCFRWTYEN